MKSKRNDYEDEVLAMLLEHLPKGVCVTLLADRGFGDIKLYKFLVEALKWDFVVRFRSGIHVELSDGTVKTANELVANNGQARLFPEARVTKARHKVGVVTVKRKGMKSSWCLATTLDDPQEVVDLYSRRFTCEETFRDEKDIRFGFGALATTISTPERRDHFLAVLMLATIALTLLGRAGEMAGCDRDLRANTERKRRTHSLFRQGREYVKGGAHHVMMKIRAQFLILIQNHQHDRRLFLLL